MPLIVRQYTYVAGALIVASQNNTNEETLYNIINGNLDEDNFSSLAEAIITFDTVSGHDHDGSNSKKIDIGPAAGPMIRAETSGTDHAIIGRSSSASTHAGIAGIGETATSYGVYVDHESSSGTGLIVNADAGGNPATFQNASGVAGDDTIKVAHRSTTSAKAAINITAVTSSGYGLYANNVAGEAIRINSTMANGTGVHITKTITSGSGLLVESADSSGTAALQVQVASQGVEILNDTDSATSRILSVNTGVAASITPATNGWIYFSGTGVANTTTLPIFQVAGASSVAGTLVILSQANTGADGPTGGTSADEWVLKVIGNGGNDDNALYVDGYTLLDGSLETKGTKNFLMDHPLYPETHLLRHSCVECPEPRNLYDGIVTTRANGLAKVQLPEYFTALNGEYRYQLTVIGQGSATVWDEIDSNGQFIISGPPYCRICWQVSGVRIDRYMKENPFVAEEKKDKPGYMNPELWNG